MDYRLRIARRYLVSRRQVTMISIITAISMVGVAVGVMLLIVVLSVFNGFFDFVRDMLVAVDPHVRIVSEAERGFSEADSLMAVALALPHVTQASPYVQGKALLVQEGSDMNMVVLIRGVEEETFGGVSEVADRTTFGRFDVSRRNGRAGVVLGMSQGQQMGLLPAGGSQPASEIALLSAPALERMFTQLLGGPPLRPFEVRGLYDLQAGTSEDRVYISLEEAQRLFRMRGRVSGIELRLDDLNQAEAVKAALQAQLDGSRFRVLTWYDLQKSLYDVMVLEKWGASLVLMLIVIVAVFNIIGSLTMVVVEKRRDIGVLQAMGVSRKNIKRIFLTEGLLIGGVGAGVGLVLGLGLALVQQHYQLVPLLGAEAFLVDAYPVAIQPLDVIVVVVVSVVLCVLAALYPATRAASIEPAQAVQIDG